MNEIDDDEDSDTISLTLQDEENASSEQFT